MQAFSGVCADSDLLVRYLYEADLKVYYLNNRDNERTMKTEADYL